jgi:hypothetical protein
MFEFVFSIIVLIHVIVLFKKNCNISFVSLIVESIVFYRRTLSYVSGLQQQGWLLLRLQGWTLTADLTVTSWRDPQTATTPDCLHND